MNLRPAALILKNQKILLLRYEYNGVSVYNLPGGNHEEGETLEQTLVREMEEELGIVIKVKDLFLASEMQQKDKKSEMLHLVFNAEIIENEPIINPEQTSAKEVVWLPKEHLLALNMYPNIGEKLLARIINKQENVYIGKIKQIWF